MSGLLSAIGEFLARALVRLYREWQKRRDLLELGRRRATARGREAKGRADDLPNSTAGDTVERLRNGDF